MSKCPFCDFKNDARGTVIMQNEYCLYIECNDNILEGWGMIIPKQHRETVFDLTSEEWEATFSLLREVKKHIDERFQPEGYNVGWNVGKIGGQEVFHAHLHIIPRYKDEPYAGKGIRHWFKQVENKRKKAEQLPIKEEI
jgi:diadenosine tetraphosphate (Ap4A) HIT family hydrolase